MPDICLCCGESLNPNIDPENICMHCIDMECNIDTEKDK